jgi:iron complex outermembrane recepter protein
MKKLFFLLLPFLSFAQDKITIQYIDVNKSAVVGVSSILKELTDSTKSQYALSDTNGVVVFKLSKNVKYTLKASSIGFRPFEKVLSAKEGFQIITLNEDATSLNNVEVRAKKPLITQDEDKMVIDPEPLAASSASAFDVIEKTPGVFIDSDGNIFLNGMTPANVYINGREQRMSKADIATVLKSLPPNSIEKMEIMRTPSAKFDASGGNGGIINIVLKKNVKIGRNGTIGLLANKGTFSNQTLNLNLTNNDGDLTTYVNTSISNRKNFDEIQTTRLLAKDNNTFVQKAYTITPNQAFYLGYGISKEPNKKLLLSYDGRINRTLNQNETQNNIAINSNKLATSLSEIANKVKNNLTGFSINQDISARYKIDTIGSEITADFNYNFFNNANKQEYATAISKPTAIEFGGFGDAAFKRNFGMAQIDAKYKLPNKVSIEVGVKSTIQRFKNTADFYLISKQKTEQDFLRTNAYLYDENINAAYIQGLKTYKKFTLKVGTRLENTRMFGNQLVPYDTTFKINRTDLFPFVYLSRAITKIAGFELVGNLTYNRSISRPSYDYLNPFPKYLDQYTFDVGNPSLRPQFTETFEANVLGGGYPIFAMGKRYTKDIFTNVIYQDPTNQAITYKTYDNLGKNEETYFRLVGAIPPISKYFFVVVTQYSRNNYTGTYEDRPINFNRGSWTFFTFHEYKITKKMKIQLNGFYVVKGQNQFYELSNFGQLGMNINRQFLDKKLFINLGINDMLYSNRNNFTLNQGTVSASGSRRSDSRRASINIRYNFGLKKKEEKSGMFDGINTSTN